MSQVRLNHFQPKYSNRFQIVYLTDSHTNVLIPLLISDENLKENNFPDCSTRSSKTHEKNEQIWDLKLNKSSHLHSKNKKKLRGCKGGAKSKHFSQNFKKSTNDALKNNIESLQDFSINFLKTSGNNSKSECESILKPRPEFRNNKILEVLSDVGAENKLKNETFSEQKNVIQMKKDGYKEQKIENETFSDKKNAIQIKKIGYNEQMHMQDTVLYTKFDNLLKRVERSPNQSSINGDTFESCLKNRAILERKQNIFDKEKEASVKYKSNFLEIEREKKEKSSNPKQLCFYAGVYSENNSTLTKEDLTKWSILLNKPTCTNSSSSSIIERLFQKAKTREDEKYIQTFDKRGLNLFKADENNLKNIALSNKKDLKREDIISNTNVKFFSTSDIEININPDVSSKSRDHFKKKDDWTKVQRRKKCHSPVRALSIIDLKTNHKYYAVKKETDDEDKRTNPQCKKEKTLKQSSQLENFEINSSYDNLKRSKDLKGKNLADAKNNGSLERLKNSSQVTIKDDLTRSICRHNDQNTTNVCNTEESFESDSGCLIPSTTLKGAKVGFYILFLQ